MSPGLPVDAAGPREVHVGRRVRVGQAALGPLDHLEPRSSRRCWASASARSSRRRAASHFGNAGPGLRLGFDPTRASLAGVFLAQMAIGVLAVLVVSAEYSTGTIRATFSAAPRRLWVLTAKAIVFSVVAFAVVEAVSFAAFFVGQAILSGKAPTASLSGPGVLRAVVSAGLYVLVLGLIALGLATIIRHTAASISTFVGRAVRPADHHRPPAGPAGHSTSAGSCRPRSAGSWSRPARSTPGSSTRGSASRCCAATPRWPWLSPACCWCAATPSGASAGPSPAGAVARAARPAAGGWPRPPRPPRARPPAR